MLELNSLSQNSPNHSRSVSNRSSQWSISTSNIGRDTLCSNSVTNYDTESPNSKRKRCAPFRKLIKSIFHRPPRKALIPKNELFTATENNSFQHHLFIKFQEHVNLLDVFINTSLIPKLKTYSELTSFPPTFISRSSELSLPTAQVWTATYLLKMLRDFRQENSKPMELQPYRKLFMSVYWDMEMAKKIGVQFYLKFIEFFSVINVTLKELRGVFLHYSPSFVQDIRNKLNLPDPLELNIRTKDRSTVALQIKPSFTPELPFSFTVETILKCDKDPELRPVEFLQLGAVSQEHIIIELLISTMKIMENGGSVMESSIDRILSRGIIISGAVPSKDVTCFSTVKAAKHLLEKIIFKRRRGLKLNQTDEKQLFQSLIKLFKSWNTYVELANSILRRFFELCDMITICYSFALHHIHLNILEMTTLQKEVEIAIQAYNKKIMNFTFQCPGGKTNLKNYAMASLLKESEESPIEPSRQWGEYYGRLMVSTRYHLLLHQYHLELEEEHRKYIIALRTIPDLETVNSTMILSINPSTVILTGARGDYRNVINFNIFEDAQVESFKMSLVKRS